MKTLITFSLFITLFYSCTSNEVKTANEKEIALVENYLNSNNFQKAEIVCDSLLRFYPKDFVLMTMEGQALTMQSKFDKAILILNNAIVIEPKYHKSYIWRAKACLWMGGHPKEDIIKDLNSAIATNQESGYCYFEKAGIHFQFQEYPLALQCYEKSINSGYTNNCLVYVFLGVTAGKMGNNDLAESSFQKALDMEHENPIILQYRIQYYFESKQYKKSLDDMTVFLDKKNDNITPITYTYMHNDRGYVEYMLGDYNAALNDINISLESDNKNVHAYRNRALVNIALNHINTACEDLSTAISITPNSTYIYGESAEKLSAKYCAKK